MIIRGTPKTNHAAAAGAGTSRPPGESGEAGTSRPQSGNPEPAPPLSWPRPDSPTHKRLREDALRERDTQETSGPRRPACAKAMTPEQATAAEMFRNNIRDYDPLVHWRKRGEFGQTFGRDGNGMAATSPLRYSPGGSLTMKPQDFPPETTLMIHSHPPDPRNPSNPTDFPSNADVYGAYLRSRGNTNGIKEEMIYHVPTNSFLKFKGKIDPGTGAPKFKLMQNPFEMGPPQAGQEARRDLPTGLKRLTGGRP